jgi:hypothetical protein
MSGVRHPLAQVSYHALEVKIAAAKAQAKN